MVTRIFNLILALGSILVAAIALGDERIRWSPEKIMWTIVAPCWLASAVGLFFRFRLAWSGSLLGVATLLCSSVATFGWGIVMWPAAQDPTDGVGYALITGALGLAMSVPVIVGLILMRGELLCDRNSDSDQMEG